MADERFDALYKKLNTEQRQAVDAIEGPVIVIAGPGTGKTSILTLRIANIVKQTDTAPENILALTFTESGVHSIRKKLVDIMGAVGYRVAIYTFHSFCNDIIKRFPQEFPRIIGAQHVTDVDQIRILEDIILTSELESLKPAGSPLFYLKSLLSFIKDLKREDVGPAEYQKHVARFEKDLEDIEDLRHEKGAYKGEIKAKYKPALRKVENSKELALVYEKYQAALEEKHLYDYEDMVVEVLRELRDNKHLLLELQETYQYVLADEHQDANRGQNRLLELLSGFHEQPNLFVVGDEKQAIFRFQGASLENFLYFTKRFPDAAVISLTKNYRSSQYILDASHSLIEKNQTKQVKLEAHADHVNDGGVARITVVECENPRTEAEYLARDVGQKIKNRQMVAEQVAVLFRDNRDGEYIARTLEQYGIPYVLHADIDVAADEQIQKLLMILRAINHFGDEKLLSQMLFIDFLKLDHLDVFKLFAEARRTRRSIADTMRSVDFLELAGVENPEVFVRLFDLLHELSISAKNKSLIESFQEAVVKLGFVGYLLGKPKATEHISAYDALLSHMVELVERHRAARLADYLDMLDKMALHGVSVRGKGVAVRPGRVNLMTTHRSKGLEFDAVYCLHINEGRWGGRRNSSYFLPITASTPDETESDMSDERRLLYVALTRARKEIVLTYATHNATGREILPSQFIGEIHPDLVELKKDTTRLPQTPEEIALHPSVEVSVKSKEYISSLFLERGFSVSALNNYLSCPWRYFFVNLLAIPSVQDRFQLYGTSIHEVLKVFFDAYRDERTMSKVDMLDLFEKYLNRKPLTEHDYKMFLEKGKESLGGYYDAYVDKWPRNVFNEFNVSGVTIPVVVPGDTGVLPSGGSTVDIVLRGNLDKIELIDGSDSAVNVVDYKTGNPKSRKDIEGETKTSEGNYKRQLVFYKLLLDRFDSGRFVMKTGEIDFVEPNKQGNYKREKFDVGDEEVNELVEVVKKSAIEIMTLAFWNRTCDDPECEYCAARKFLN